MDLLSCFLIVLCFPLGWGLFWLLPTGMVYTVFNYQPAPACYRPPGDHYPPFATLRR